MAADPKKNRVSTGPNLTGTETAAGLAAIDERRLPLDQAPSSQVAPPPPGGIAAGSGVSGSGVANARQAIVSKAVSVSPLAVLLPRLGDSKNLERVIDLLAERLEDLRQDPPAGGEDDMRARMLEEEMLVRVIGWTTGDGQSKRKKGS